MLATLIKLVFIATLIIHCRIGFSGTEIRQLVETELSAEKLSSNYLWQITKNKFRLEVASSNGRVYYIFNGRNLYVCSQASANLIQTLQELKVSDKSFLKKIKNGSCQAVPANFMAKFFLSPAAALSTLDYSDAMQMTLLMKSYTFSKQKQNKVLNVPCTMAERQFVIARQAEDKKKDSKTHQSVKESICYTDAYNWRKPLWKQISMNLLRQPSARGLYKKLKDDASLLNGFILSSKGSFEKVDAKGIVKQGKRETQTIGITEKSLSNRLFQPPAGYSIVDIQSVVLSHKSKDNLASEKEYQVEKDPIPVFLYHLLGGVL
ncbi:MAG: hypothetical protein R3B45_07015 [Bdellovibrionota bacterium]